MDSQDKSSQIQAITVRHQVSATSMRLAAVAAVFVLGRSVAQAVVLVLTQVAVRLYQGKGIAAVRLARAVRQAVAAAQAAQVEASQAQRVVQAAHRQLATGQARPTTILAVAVAVVVRLVVLAQRAAQQARQTAIRHQHQQTQVAAVVAGNPQAHTPLSQVLVAQAVLVRWNFAT